MKSGTVFILAMAVAVALAGCDRVGSEAWCKKQDEKPKSEWSLLEASDYTKYCVLGMDPAKWCEKQEQKPKSDWTAKEAAEYAKNCIGRGD
jgi:hypothetical protein